ncbi:MAG: hypothetical protein ACRDV9_02990, partial [Acidimicrobiia bacterium]
MRRQVHPARDVPEATNLGPFVSSRDVGRPFLPKGSSMSSHRCTARPRARHLAAALVGSLVVVVTSLSVAPALADHTIGGDPAAYGEPHAGWVAPPRAGGRLAPATGSLLGVHPEDSMDGPIDAQHQKIMVTEEHMGRRMDIN